MSRLLIFAAPSGAGKTTIVRHLASTFPSLAFSVSATTRARRSYEEHGRDYYFYTVPEFEALVAADAFVEWEEVYEGQFYGTLRSEIDRLLQGSPTEPPRDVIFDIDVRGALNIKRHYPDASLTVFVKPPSQEVLYERLRGRNTESEESLQKRLAKAAIELAYEDQFDTVLVNDVLADALREAEALAGNFLGQPGEIK